MTERLEAIRRRSDELHQQGEDDSDEAIELNMALFDADPADREICERLGIGLHDGGELEQAREIFARCLEMNPEHGVAKRRLDEIEKALAKRPARSAERVIERAFRSVTADQRAMSLSFMASSITEAEAIDRDALAVTERLDGFSVFVGAALACQPRGDRLNVKLHEIGYRGLIEQIQVAGAERLRAAKIALPHQVWVGVPMKTLEQFRDEVMDSHRQYLVEAVEAGRTYPHPRLPYHRPDLRAYLLEEAKKARTEGSHR